MSDGELGLLIQGHHIARAGQDMNGRGIFAENSAGDIIGHNQVQVLAKHFVARIGHEILGFGRKSDQYLMVFRLAERCQYVLGWSERKRGWSRALLYLVCVELRRTVISDCRCLYYDIHLGIKTKHGILHFRRATDADRLHA